MDAPTETQVEGVKAEGAAGILGGRARRKPWCKPRCRPRLGILLAVLQLGGLAVVVSFLIPAAESIDAARLVQGAELEIIRECGHIPHEEQPEAFLDAVGPLLTGVQ